MKKELPKVQEESDIDCQKRALLYLYDQASAAHYNGDGILVNHICAITLEKVRDLIKKGKLYLSLGEIHWAASLAMYWLVDEYMLSPIRELIHGIKARNEAERMLLSILQTAFFLIEQSLDDSKDSIEKLKKCNLNLLPNRAAFEDSILLTFAIELVWCRNPYGDDWLKLLDTWIEQTQENNKRDLTKLKNRLNVQTQILYGASDQRSEKKLIEELDTNIQNISRAWESFLDCNWDTLDVRLKGLVASISYESPLALPIFNLHHSTRLQRVAPGSQIIGLSRRRLQISSRKAAIFDGFREMAFYKNIAQLWRKETLSEGARARFHCFRLAMLIQISALRGWEIISWIDGVRQQYEANRELFRFKDQNYIPYVASEMIRLSALSGILQRDDPFLINAVQELDEFDETIRVKVIKTLLAMSRFSWSYVLNALHLFSDPIPDMLLPSVASWCVNYLNNPIAPFPENPAEILSFWSDILGYTPRSEDICRILHPLGLAAARDIFSWRLEKNGLEEYMTYAPLNLAREVGETMFAIKSEDINFNPYRWSIVFSAAVKREELVEYFKDYLASTAKEPIQNIQLPSLQSVEKKFNAADDAEFRNWCRNQILSKCNSVIGRKSAGGGFGGEIIPRVIELVTWPKEENDLINSLLSALKASHVRDDEISLFLSYLSELVFSGPISQVNLIRDDFFHWLNNIPSGEDFLRNLQGPLSSINIKISGHEDIFCALCNLAITMCIKDESNICSEVAKWIVSNIRNAPIKAVALIFYLVSLLGISHNYMDNIDVVSALNILIMRSDQFPHNKPGDYHFIRSLARQIEILFDPSSETPASFHKSRNIERLELLFRILSIWILKLAEYTDPTIRASVARIIRYWKELSTVPPELELILERLKKDARARVRQAASE